MPICSNSLYCLEVLGCLCFTDTLRWFSQGLGSPILLDNSPGNLGLMQSPCLQHRAEEPHGLPPLCTCRNMTWEFLCRCGVVKPISLLCNCRGISGACVHRHRVLILQGHSWGMQRDSQGVKRGWGETHRGSLLWPVNLGPELGFPLTSAPLGTRATGVPHLCLQIPPLDSPCKGFPQCMYPLLCPRLGYGTWGHCLSGFKPLKCQERQEPDPVGQRPWLTFVDANEVDQLGWDTSWHSWSHSKDEICL